MSRLGSGFWRLKILLKLFGRVIIARNDQTRILGGYFGGQICMPYILSYPYPFLFHIPISVSKWVETGSGNIGGEAWVWAAIKGSGPLAVRISITSVRAGLPA